MFRCWISSTPASCREAWDSTPVAMRIDRMVATSSSAMANQYSSSRIPMLGAAA